ncbi:hypothetical protein EST35_0409 [Pseudomonas phage vB_PaeM_PA5oct]|uniref:Uncharacterized protein n=1 Tax=Pseudomonas phage vB_PaeM_PA5oct TaxID=2163605 RepID=A0A4Y5JV86_9CAUD|nr:hypothetical protein PQE65_gp086 [Pseudomonas phage vB_PaeM_PA5oct]QCG76279.1 hypothetical protein EST35_0409 [Pseudomonas phage vB_PaeM_PA5oct]
MVSVVDAYGNIEVLVMPSNITVLELQAYTTELLYVRKSHCLCLYLPNIGNYALWFLDR